MANVIGQGGFNNLLYNTRKAIVADRMEHLAGHIGMDLSPKEPARIDELLTAKASQINGKSGDLKYVPTPLHSRPYYGYDARYDPTLLNSIRNKYVDVSGTLIPNKYLSVKQGLNQTVRPLTAYGRV